MTRSDGLVQEEPAQHRRQNVSDCRERQHKAEIGPTEQSHARQEPQNEQRDSQRYERDAAWRADIRED